VENRIKEQMCLFAGRLSTDEMKGNQLRLYFSALAYTMIEALRRLALSGTEWAQAQVDTFAANCSRSEPSSHHAPAQFGLSRERDLFTGLQCAAPLTRAHRSDNHTHPTTLTQGG
jgi:hypothetical protein